MQMVNQRWRHLCGPPAFLFRFEYPPLTVFPRAFADPFVDPSSLPPPLVGKITLPLLQEGPTDSANEEEKRTALPLSIVGIFSEEV